MRITKVPLRDRLGAPGVLGLLLVALLTLGSVFTAPAAHAATTNVSITGAQLDKSSAGSGDKVRMSFNWAVPNGAQPGDTFTIVLPSEVRPANTAKFVLERSPGEVVAEAVWNGNTATFTLAEFVRNKQNIQGSAYFYISWDRSNVNTEAGGDYNLNFSGTNSWTLPLTLLPDGPSGTGQSNSKVGWWLSDDQGAGSPKRQLGWVVYLNTGTATPVDSLITITDAPGAGSHIDLDSVEGYVNDQPLRKERYTVTRLGEHGISISLVGNYPGEQAVYDGENIYFRYASDLLPGENGIFTNSATITGNSDGTDQVSAEVRRDGAGGDGNGNQPPEKKVTPVAPTVTQALCTEDGTATAPNVTVAETDGITYTVAGDMKAGSTVTVTATAGKGHTLTAAEGWTLAEDKQTATFTVELKDVACDQPVAPVAPTVTQAVCTEDGTATAPNLTAAETAGITYSLAGDVKAGSTVTVTATANEGSFLTAAEGWTLAKDKQTATFTVELKDVACDQPVVPVAPTVTQALCTEDGSATAPNVTAEETAGITYSLAGDMKAGSTVTVTATAEQGSFLTAAEGWTLAEDKQTATFTVELKDVACDQPVAPVAPTVTQAVCTEDGSATAPTVTAAETAGVTYTVAGEMKAGSTVTVTATANEGSFLTPAEGWTLAEDKQTATFTVELKDVACDQPVAPVAPTVTQALCTEDGTATVPNVTVAETAGITYSLAGDMKAGSTVIITATAEQGSFLKPTEGWTISDDKKTAIFTVELKDVACDQPVTPVAPTVTQAVCTEDGSATAPTVTVAETTGVTYKVDGDVKAGSTVTVTATADDGSFLTEAEGWTLAEDKQTATFTVELKDVACDQPVAPVAPTVTQALCTEDGTATLPTVSVAETAGVTYAVAGDVKAGSTVTVTATADKGSFLKPAEGWTLATDGRTATIKITLDAPKCTTKTPTTTPPTNKPDAEQHTPPAAKSPLAATGLASAPIFFGSAALLVLVGLTVVGARRKA